MKNTFAKRLISGVTAALLAVSSLNTLFAQAKNVKNIPGTQEIDDAVLLAGEPFDGETYDLLVRQDLDATLNKFDETYLLGIAADFSVFLNGDFEIHSSDAEGRTAVGGNIINECGYSYEIGKGDYGSETSLEKLLNHHNYATIILGGKIEKWALGKKPYPDGEDKKLVINQDTNPVGSLPENYDTAKLPVDGGEWELDQPLTYVTQLFDFDKEFAKLEMRSVQLADNADSGHVDTSTPDTIRFIYDGDPEDRKECVYFTLSLEDFEKYRSAKYISFEGIPKLPESRQIINNDAKNYTTWEYSYIVINVKGEGDENHQIHLSNDDNKFTTINNIDISNPCTPGEDVENQKKNNHPGVTSILYNFYQATAETEIVLGRNFQGTIFAPISKATDEQMLKNGGGDHGHLSGALIAKSFKGYTEFGYRPFSGPIKIAETSTGYRIGITKVDADEENVYPDGATFGIFEALTDAQGNFQRDTETGKVLFSERASETVDTSKAEEDFINLKPGYYVLREITPPDGYDIDPTEYYFVVEEVQHTFYLKKGSNDKYELCELGEIDPDDKEAIKSAGIMEVTLPTIMMTICENSEFDTENNIAQYEYSAFRAATHTYMLDDKEVVFHMFDETESMIQGTAYVTIGGTKYEWGSEEFQKFQLIKVNMPVTSSGVKYQGYIVLYEGQLLEPRITLTKVLKADTSNDFNGFIFKDKKAVTIKKIDKGTRKLVAGALIDLKNETYKLNNETYERVKDDYVSGWTWDRPEKDERSTAYVTLDKINHIAIDEDDNYINIYRLHEIEPPSGYDDPVYDTIFISAKIDGKDYLYTKQIPAISETDTVITVPDLPVSYNVNDETWSEIEERIKGENDKDDTGKWTKIDLSIKEDRVIEIENEKISTIEGAKIKLRKINDSGAPISGAKISLYHYDPSTSEETEIYTWDDFPGEIGRSQLKSIDSQYIKNGYLVPGIYYLMETESPHGYNDDLKDVKLYFTVNEDYSISTGYSIGEPEELKITIDGQNGDWHQYYVKNQDGSTPINRENVEKIEFIFSGNPNFNYLNFYGTVNNNYFSYDKDSINNAWKKLDNNHYIYELNEPFNISISELQIQVNNGVTLDSVIIHYPAGEHEDGNPALSIEGELNDYTLSITNKAQYAVGVSKVEEGDSEKNLLSGAEFTLFEVTASGENPIATATSTDKLLQFAVEAGKQYVIRETSPPDGYTVNGGMEYRFKVTEGEIVEATFELPDESDDSGETPELDLEPVIYKVGESTLPDGTLFTKEYLEDNPNDFAPAQKSGSGNEYKWGSDQFDISQILYLSTSNSGNIIESLTFIYNNGENNPISNFRDVVANNNTQTLLTNTEFSGRTDGIIEIKATLIQTPNGEEDAEIVVKGGWYNDLEGAVKLHTSKEKKEEITILGGSSEITQYYRIVDENDDTVEKVKITNQYDGYNEYYVEACDPNAGGEDSEGDEDDNIDPNKKIFSAKKITLTVTKPEPGESVYDPFAIDNNTYYVDDSEYQFKLENGEIIEIYKDGQLVTDPDVSKQFYALASIASYDNNVHYAIVYDGDLLYPDFVLTRNLTGNVKGGFEFTNTKSEIEISKKIYDTTTELPGAKLMLTLDRALKDVNAALTDVIVENVDNNTVEWSVDGLSITWTSTETPAKFTGLPDGIYTLSEIEAPDGYEIADPITFYVVNGVITKIDDVECETNIVEVTMFDEPKSDESVKPSIKIQKVDESGNSLSGAEFEMHYRKTESGEYQKIESWISDGRTWQINDLEDGFYIIKETKAPDGYKRVNDTEFSVENGEIKGLTVSTSGVFQITNKLSEVTINKVGVGEDSTGLAGAKFKLTYIGEGLFDTVVESAELDINIVDKTITWTSTTNGTVIKGLPDGKYTLEEIEAPDGYTLAAPITFTIENGVIIMLNDDVKDNLTAITVEDSLSEIEISKKNFADKEESESEELSGAEFTLTLDDNSTATLKSEMCSITATLGDNNKSLTWTSGNTPAKFTGLPDGEYTLKETKAPGGYEELNAEIRFTIENGIIITETDSNNEFVSFDEKLVTVFNKRTTEEEPGVQMPEAGGSGTLPYQTVGLTIMGVTLMAAVMFKRRREQNI